MALADELLDSISEEQFAEYMLVEENPHIVIDEDRNIILPERYKIIAAQGDHDMATYTFDCPRFSDGRDMSKMVVYINYIRSDGETGSYPADNVSIDAQDNDLMHFEWTPLLPATLEHGAFAFLVCVCRAEPDGSIKNHWSTRLCKDATISEGMDCHKDTIINMYPDVITRILERLNVLEDGGTTSVQYTVQDLEEEQKVQARKNIEAADAKEVSKLSEEKVNGVGITAIMAITQSDYDKLVELERVSETTLYIIADYTGESGGTGNEDDNVGTLIPYLSSDGTAYINLDIAPIDGASYEICLRAVDGINNGGVFGNRYTKIQGAGGNAIKAYICGYYNGSAYATFGEGTIDISKKRIFTLTNKSLIFDNDIIKEITAGTNTKTSLMYLFATNNADTNNGQYVSGICAFTFFYLKIRNADDELIYYYKPAKDSEGVACVYEAVNGTYLYNANTSGSFTYGEELEES